MPKQTLQWSNLCTALGLGVVLGSESSVLRREAAGHR